MPISASRAENPGWIESKPEKIRALYTHKTLRELHGQIEAARAERDPCLSGGQAGQGQSCRGRATGQQRCRRRRTAGGRGIPADRRPRGRGRASADASGEVRTPRRVRRAATRKAASGAIRSGCWSIQHPEEVREAIREADARRQEAEERAKVAEYRENRASEQASDALRQWSAVSPERRILTADLAASPFRGRYGVTVVERPEIITVPTQDTALRQIAAALYAAGRDAGWERSVFDEPDTGATEIVRIAGSIRLISVASGRSGSRSR